MGRAATLAPDLVDRTRVGVEDDRADGAWCAAVGGGYPFPALFEAALCVYLREHVFPQLSRPPYGDVEVVPVAERKPVYLFREKRNNVQVIGKLFGDGVTPLAEAWLRATKEYSGLRLLRERYGMDGDTCRVVAPLGKSRALSALLVTERATGVLLDRFIQRGVEGHGREELFEKLALLAGFFVRLHRNSANGRPVSPALPRRYMRRLLDRLSVTSLGFDEREDIESCASAWWGSDAFIGSDQEVIVHGDATPTNFLLDGDQVIGIDLERMKWADRCWDLGFVVAELKHHFLWRTGDRWASEPFIGHFLWQYSVGYRDGDLFAKVTRKIPLYMAMGLLRIARNDWLDESYRRELVREAVQCLRYGL